MEIKLVTYRQKNIQSAPNEIWTHDLMFASFITYQLCYVVYLKIKTQLKVYEDEQLFVILKNTNKLFCIFLNKKNNFKMNIYKNRRMLV